MHTIVKDADGQWQSVDKWPRWFDKWQSGFCLGHNKANRWFLSAHHSWRGPKFAFEWHNYSRVNTTYRTDTLFVSFDVGLRADQHSKLNWSVTVWPRESGWLWNLLSRIPAYVYRKY